MTPNTIQTSHTPRYVALLGLVALSACGAKVGNNGGSTSWLACTEDSECPSKRCVEQRCVPDTDAAIADAPPALTSMEQSPPDADPPMSSALPAEAGPEVMPDAPAAQATATSVPPSGLATPTSTPLQLVSGGFHSCARFEDGSVWCWGLNDYGQLGDGTTTATAGPTQALVSDVVRLAAGKLHTCAITEADEVYCWGDNMWGQVVGSGLGGPEGADRLYTAFPEQVDVPAGTWTEIAASDLATCVVDQWVHPYCWGTDTGGTLSPPRQVAGVNLSVATGLQMNSSGARFVDQSGDVQGFANWTDSATPSSDIGTKTSRVVLRYNWDCRVKNTGDVWCRTGTDPFTWDPHLLAKWGDLAIGQDFRCTIQGGSRSLEEGYQNHLVVCTSDNLWGAGSATGGPYPVPTIPPAYAITVAETHACAIGLDGSIWCWGAPGPRSALAPYQLSQTTSNTLEEPLDPELTLNTGDSYVNALAKAHQRDCSCDPTGVGCDDPVPSASSVCLDVFGPSAAFDCAIQNLNDRAHTACEDSVPVECDAVPQVQFCSGARKYCPAEPDGTFNARSWCDGTNNCSNGFDEYNCGSGASQFICSDLSEVGLDLVCDGLNDCNDGSDELNCAR